MRLAILGEGRTEEEFVNNLLRDPLQNSGVEVHPVLLNGNVNAQRVASDLAKLHWDFDYVTSLVDFYGFKDRKDDSPDSLQERIDNMTAGFIRRKYNKERVFSYVQQHEFEALLFSRVDAFDQL